MATFYDEMRAVAVELLTEFGVPEGKTISGYIRVTSPSSGADEWNPGEGEDSDYPAIFAIVNYNLSQRDGTRIQQKDQRAIIAQTSALSIPPAASHKLLDSSKIFLAEIVHVDPVDPSLSSPVVYDCQVRS